LSTGRVRRRTASINWKIAVLAPIPRARDGDEGEGGVEAKLAEGESEVFEEITHDP